MMDNEKETESSLEYWLHAIELKAPDSSIIVVGTHLDLIEERRIPLQPPSTIVSKFSHLISEWISVSCTTGKGIDYLRNYLIELAMEKQIKIPSEWIQFGNHLSSQTNGSSSSWIDMEEVKRLANEPKYGLSNDNDLSLAIQVLHNIGYLLYFPPSSLEESNIIILDPQWLVNILKSIVTVKQVSGMNGGWIAHNEASLESIWPWIDKSMHSFILGLLYKFRIALKSKGQSLIPCQLDPVPSRITNQYGKLLVQLEFTEILPEDLFPSFIASPQVLPFIDLDHHQIWKDAAILQDQDNQENQLFVQQIGKRIQLFGETSSNFLVDITSIIIKIIKKNWQGKQFIKNNNFVSFSSI
jgi:hypothetical protein